jgi:hypothetical protein
VLSAHEAVSAAPNFLDFTRTLELLNNSWKKAAAAMLEFHPMSNLANAYRLILRLQVRKHLFAGDFGHPWLLVLDGVFSSHDVRLLRL